MTTDPVSGSTDGISGSCGEAGTRPKIVHSNTSTEVWQGARC